MEHIVRELQAIEPKLIIEQYNGQRLDAAIATGSDSAALHFKAQFGDIPALIRGSRHSAALLMGNESQEQLEALSLIFAPQGYNFSLTVPPMPLGYNNNYRHTRALMTMQGKVFNDIGGALTVESGAEFPRQISCINICRYDSIDEVKQWLSDNDSRLQCIVAAEKIHSRTVNFGQAQYPALNDYADEVDVMKFLVTISLM